MRKNKSIESLETNEPSNLNLYIEFTKLIKIYEYIYTNLTDLNEKTVYKHKIISLKNSAKHIKLFKEPITSTKQIEDLPGMGKKSILRIQEFIDTKKLSDVDNYCNLNNCDLIFNKQSSGIYDDLITIFGIGDKLAKQLIHTNKITSIKELQKKVNSGTLLLCKAENSHDTLDYRYLFNEGLEYNARTPLCLTLYQENSFGVWNPEDYKVDMVLLYGYFQNYNILKARFGI